jgi:hypothetical protein
MTIINLQKQYRKSIYIKDLIKALYIQHRNATLIQNTQNNNENRMKHITHRKIRLQVKKHTAITINILLWEGIMSRMFYLISASPPT